MLSQTLQSNFRSIFCVFLAACFLCGPANAATSTVTQVFETTLTNGLLVITETVTTTFLTSVADPTTSPTTTTTSPAVTTTTTLPDTSDTTSLPPTTSVTSATTVTRTTSSSTVIPITTSSSAPVTTSSSTTSSATSTSSSTSETPNSSSSATSGTSSATSAEDPGTSTITETQSGRQATQTSAVGKSSLGGGAIAGIVVAGVVALGIAAFVIWWCTRKRFGDLGGSSQDGDIKWPEMERNATHLQPLPTKPSAGHGIAMGDTMSNPNRSALEDEDDDDLSGLENSAHSGTGLTQGSSGAGYYDSGFQPAQPDYSQSSQPDYGQSTQHDLYGMSPPRQNMYAPSTSPPMNPGYDQYHGGYR